MDKRCTEPRRHAGFKEQLSHEQVKRAFRQPDQRYAPYQFWFWDQPLSQLGIKAEDMAHEMYEKGFNPGYAHARTNYAREFSGDGASIPAITKEEWLGDEWFEAVGRVLRQAETDGSCFTVADEFGWPSLQAGGRVLERYPEMRSRSLSYEILDVACGEAVSLPASDFAVAAKLCRTESTSYAAFFGEGWKRRNYSWDASRPSQTETLPYNFSAQYSGDRSARAVFTPNLPGDGCYRLLARWTAGEESTDCAQFTVQCGGRVETVRVSQRENGLRWNELGEFELSAAGAPSIELSNQGEGVLCADAIRLESVRKAEDYVVIDDHHTLNRKIGVIDAATLNVLPDGKKEWCAPSGEGCWRIYCFKELVQRGYDGSLVDNLDERLGERFAEIAYRPYFERLERFMGENRPMNGIFADTEGGFGFKLAWSESLERRFRERTGEELKRLLPLMFDRDEGGLEGKVRFDWYDIASDLFTENFMVPIRQAEQHGMYYTMHTWEESLPFQANLVGDYFKLNRAVTLPGTDCLQNTAYNPANFWDTMSAAELDGKRCMAEMMALSGLQDYTMAELKRQANALAAWGISHVVTHSVKMTRRYAQHFVTPDFYDVDPGWRYMRQWTDYVRRFSCINAQGALTADVLLLNPMDSIWALTDGANMDPSYDIWDVGGGIPANTASHGGRASEINRMYHETIRQLVNARVELLTADKAYLRRMTVANGWLVDGAHRFRTVVLPPMTMLDREAAEKLEAFAQAGGMILSLGELPSGSPQVGTVDPEIQSRMRRMCEANAIRRIDSLAEALRAGDEALRPQVAFVEGEFNLLALSRDIEGRRWVWLANNDECAHACVLRIAAGPGGVSRWNPEDGSETELSARFTGEGMEVSLQMAAGEGFFLVVDPDRQPKELEKCTETELAALEGGWRARLDAGNTRELLELSFAPVCADRVRVVLRKGSLRSPEAALVSRIRLGKGAEAGATVRASSGENAEAVLRDDEAFWSNSAPMTWGDSQFIELRLPEARSFDRLVLQTKEGEPLRDFRLEVWDGNWWRTLAAFQECNECERMHPIHVSPELIGQSCPVSLVDWRSWGLLGERFSGSIDYERTVRISPAAGETILSLGTVGQIAEAWVNGKAVGTRIAPPFDFPVTGALREGENLIRIRVSNAIASNAGAPEAVCGLIGPVRLIRRG